MCCRDRAAQATGDRTNRRSPAPVDKRSVFGNILCSPVACTHFRLKIAQRDLRRARARMRSPAGVMHELSGGAIENGRVIASRKGWEN